MKNRQVILKIGLLAAVVLSYAALCYLALHRKPSVTFEGTVSNKAREAIIDWFQNNYKLRSQRPSLENIFHAMVHPLSPPREQAIVDDENFGGVYTASYQGYLITFEEKDGNWILSDIVDVWGSMSLPNKPRHANPS